MVDKGRPVPILLMARELGAGGIERDLAKYAGGLDRSRFTPYVATFQPDGVRAQDLQRAGVPIFHVNMPSLKSVQAGRAAMQLARILREKKIRLLHAFDPSAVFAVPVARFARVPVVMSSTVGHRDLFDAATRRQLRLIDHFVDSTVVNCEAMRRHLINDFSIPERKIDLCYNGVDTSEFHPCEDWSAAGGPGLLIGTVCVLRPEKRLDLLLEAFRRVRRLAEGVELMIVGSGPELGRLQALAAQLGVTDGCVFQPAVPAVAPLMRAMDIFVSCSNSEAFSNAILEAMACGCCVVGSRVGGTPELIEDGRRGLLFEAENVNELAERLALVIKDKEMRRRLAATGAEFAANKLSLQIAVSRIAQIYENRLRERGALH